jgi:tetratricopeptide (TPR) repeat protein
MEEAAGETACATGETKESEMKNGIMTGLVALAFAGGLMAGQQPSAAPQGQAAGASAKKARAVKTPEEGKAVREVLQALTPEARIRAADEFIVQFPQSELRAAVLAAAAESYRQMNDYEKTVVYGEQALQADPDDATNVQTSVLLAKAIAQHAREFDLDREEKLAKIEKYANGALELVKTMAKPSPTLLDEQWNAVKSDWAGDAHEALGMDQLVRKDYDRAVAEFKTAVETAKDPDPTTSARLAGAYDKAGKYDEAIAVCDKLLAMPDLHPRIREVVRGERARATRAKGVGKPPAPETAAPPAPAPAPAAPPAPAPKP